MSEKDRAKWVARRRAEGESTGRPLLGAQAGPLAGPRLRRVEAIERLAAAADDRAPRSPSSSASRSRPSRVGCGGSGSASARRLEPPEPPIRYERSQPGELIHVDIKQLGRIQAPSRTSITGRLSQRRYRRPGEHRLGMRATSAIDDATRLAYVEVLPDETRPDRGRLPAPRRRPGSLEHGDHGRAGDDRQRLGCYISTIHAAACRALGMRHLRTRPYRPRTNGKAERFIQTILREWAYARVYTSSDERTTALPCWLDHYNFRRRHGSLAHRPPASSARRAPGTARSPAAALRPSLPPFSLARAGLGSWLQRSARGLQCHDTSPCGRRRDPGCASNQSVSSSTEPLHSLPPCAAGRRSTGSRSPRITAELPERRSYASRSSLPAARSSRYGRPVAASSAASASRSTIFANSSKPSSVLPYWPEA